MIVLLLKALIFAMANGEVSVLTSKSKDLSLRINDNPSLIKIEGEIVTLFCKFSSNEEAVLREVVWYRELEDGTNSKLLTYDAVMNITQVNQEFQKNIQGTGPRSIEIKSVSSLDDGWYQCHVGVYVNTSIVEKIGYIYLNILVPPKQLRIAVHEVVEGNSLFRHNFSLVCTADESKPATSLVFTRNGIEIPENTLKDSSTIVKKMAGSYAELLVIKDVSDQVSIDLKKGKLPVPIFRKGMNETTFIEYTTIHLKGRKVGKKLWESASYLLWTLQPDRDVEAEYGCKAQHQSFKQTQTFGKILRPPKAEWLVIEAKPQHPVEGGSVMLEVKRESLQNTFPSPVILWTNKVSASESRKFYVGNRILVRNLRQNNTEYKVQAFNALGSATTSKTIVLRKRRVASDQRRSSSSYTPSYLNGVRSNFAASARQVSTMIFFVTTVIC